MGITFRHDAAAVALPSVNASGRKYGQQLVLQQQQQKYAAQQAQQDRMFDAQKQLGQMQFQQNKAIWDNEMAFRREGRQNDFFMKQQEAQQQQKFMDDARKLSSGMIMEDIRNGHYDPATASKLRKNLVDEADALADKTLDATQRKKVLDGLRADRLLHTSNRMEKPPAPTPQEQFDQGVVNRNGVDYIQDSKGKWTPLEPSKAQQEQEKQQQQQMQQQEQEAQKMRPMSAQEYYSQNEDKFQKDLDSTMKSMQSEYDAGTRKEAPTPEAAWEQMQKNHDFKQKALGKAQYGEPTLAPAQPGAAPAGPAAPTAAKPYGQTLGDAWNAYTKDQSQESFKKYRDAYRSNATLSDLADKAQALPEGSKEKKDAWDLFHAERDKIIGGATSPQAAPSSPTQAAPTPVASEASLDQLDALAAANRQQAAGQPAQGDWDTLAAGQGLVDMGPAGTAPATPNPTGQTTPAAPKASQHGDASNYPWLRQPGQLMKGEKPQDANAPDFGSLTVNAADEADRQTIGKLQGAYEQAKTPEVKNAISILVNPKSLREDKMKAVRDLKKAGVDINQLTVPVEQGPGFFGSIPTGLGF